MITRIEMHEFLLIGVDGPGLPLVEWSFSRVPNSPRITPENGHLGMTIYVPTRIRPVINSLDLG